MEYNGQDTYDIMERSTQYSAETIKNTTSAIEHIAERRNRWKQDKVQVQIANTINNINF